MEDTRAMSMKHIAKAASVAADIYLELLATPGYTQETAKKEMKEVMQYAAENEHLGMCCCTNQEIGRSL